MTTQSFRNTIIKKIFIMETIMNCIKNNNLNTFWRTLFIFSMLTTLSFSTDPIKIMPLGDSITNGDRNIPQNPDANISKYKPYQHPDSKDKIAYRGKLWDLLKEDGYTFDAASGDLDFVGSSQRGSEYNSSFDTDNEGHGGFTTKQILDHISDWLDQNSADIVLLHIGTNDPAFNIPIGSYNDENQDANTSVNNVKKILDTIFDKNPDAKVMVARIIKAKLTEAWQSPLGPNGEPWTTTLFNDKIIEMVNHHPKHSQIRIVDMENGAGLEYDVCGMPHDMQPYHSDDGENNDTITYDYHPNSNGYEKMAQKWFDDLKASGWIGDSTPPVITLTGADPQKLAVGATYVELNATATDNVDGDISNKIIIDASAVNTSAEGNYTVTYNVTDVAGNNASKTREVVVSDDADDAGENNDSLPPWVDYNKEAKNAKITPENGPQSELSAVDMEVRHTFDANNFTLEYTLSATCKAYMTASKNGKVTTGYKGCNNTDDGTLAANSYFNAGTTSEMKKDEEKVVIESVVPLKKNEFFTIGGK
jgi:lysophospholipase L1-like esterase